VLINNRTGLGGVTNNTGWTDFIIAPIVGLGWIVGEATINRFIVTPIARDHRIFGGRILRSALGPSRSFAALFAGKFPGMLPAPPKVVKIRIRTRSRYSTTSSARTTPTSACLF